MSEPVPPPFPSGLHKSPAAAAVAWRRQRRQAPPGGFSNRHSRARSHAILPPGPRRSRRRGLLASHWSAGSRGLRRGPPLAAAEEPRVALLGRRVAKPPAEDLHRLLADPVPLGSPGSPSQGHTITSLIIVTKDTKRKQGSPFYFSTVHLCNGLFTRRWTVQFRLILFNFNLIFSRNGKVYGMQVSRYLC